MGNAWNYCTNTAVKRASRRLGQLYDAVLAPSGLRATQCALLTQIRLSDGPTLRGLAEAMAMDLSALGHTLKPLQRDGLVALEPDPRDRRAKRVRLTAPGEARLDAALDLWREAQAHFDAEFGAEKSAALRATLERLASPEFAAAFTAAGGRH
ncbi:MAG: MarR family transcriptional regulator [Geminicoccaceae bacterium]